jgi:H+/Cl- antiporter ClcA
MTWQLRGEAEQRQVVSAAAASGVALAHNIGLGGASFVTAYRPANR